MASPISFKRSIARESREWVQKELITQEQGAAICDQYGVDYGADNRSLGYNILVVLGILFLALSIITLIGANWDSIPRALRMSALIILTLAVQGAGLYYFSQEKMKIAVNLFFLGNFCYGASIILISQIYHLGEHMPDGIFIWALGCLPFSILCRNALLSLQTLALAMIWFYTEAALGFYPASFPLFFIASIWILWQAPYRRMLFTAVVVSVVSWMQYSLAKFWDSGRYYEFHAEHLVATVSLVCLGFFLGAYMARRNQHAAQDYGNLLRNWSLAIVLFAGVLLSYEEVWVEIQGVSWDNTVSMLALCALLTSIAGWFAWQSNQLREFAYSQLVFVAVGIYVVLFEPGDSSIYFQVASNLALIGAGVLLIITGIRSGSSKNFFSGIGLILVVALLRYIDLVGNYVGGAALFLVFALIMLGAAWSWKRIQGAAKPIGESS